MGTGGRTDQVHPQLQSKSDASLGFLKSRSLELGLADLYEFTTNITFFLPLPHAQLMLGEATMGPEG